MGNDIDMVIVSMKGKTNKRVPFQQLELGKENTNMKTNLGLDNFDPNSRVSESIPISQYKVSFASVFSILTI